MTTLVRRAAPVVATATAFLAVVLPSTAVAKKAKTDQLAHCEGSSIEGLGSTFQAPAEKVWTGEISGDGFNVSTSKLACSGSLKPTVKYNQESANQGSGACLKDYGTTGVPKMNTFPYCGTDEAPSEKVKIEMEEKAMEGTPSKGEGVQSIPVAQGAVAIVVHLPENCKATSDPDLAKKTVTLGRLSLEASVVAGVYDGKIQTWKELVAANKSAADTLTCKEASEEEETIRPVVRLDKSGTTHIFKSFLEQVDTGSYTFEEFNEINEGAGKEHTKPCGEGKAAETKTWENVSEGCENQRWVEAAHVLRAKASGNGGVLEEVGNTPSSIGYADLAFAREKGYFSKKGEGGENSPGEQNARFWAPLSNTAPGAKKNEYQEPSTNKDVEAGAASNCKDTVYVAHVGEKFPPASTRFDWSKVKGTSYGKTYGICGVTYVLAARTFYPWLHKQNASISEEASKKIATTVSNYIVWLLNEKTGGGGAELIGHDYEPLPKKVQKIAEEGALEIGSKEA